MIPTAHLPLCQPENTLNDPKRTLFWAGPLASLLPSLPARRPRQHWGHAISDDLIHWQDLPYAIYPNPEERCYSGAALVEEDRVIAIYHGTKVGNMVAVSHDPLLLNWEKLTARRSFPRPAPTARPCPTGSSIPASGRKGTTTTPFLAVPCPTQPPQAHPRQLPLPLAEPGRLDYLHPFVEDDRFTLIGDDGACPYFWPIGDRHILLFYSHMSGGQACWATMTPNATSLSSPRTMISTSAPPSRAASMPIGNAGRQRRRQRYLQHQPANRPRAWNQIMTLPRRLTLQGTDKIGRDTLVEPAGDVESLRREHRQITDLTLPANQEIVLGSIRGDAIELMVEIEANDAPLFELNVLRSPAKRSLPASPSIASAASATGSGSSVGGRICWPPPTTARGPDLSATVC